MSHDMPESSYRGKHMIHIGGKQDSKHMIATIWFMCVFKSSPGNKKASDSE